MIVCSSKQRIGLHFDPPKPIVEPHFGSISHYPSKQIVVSRLQQGFKHQDNSQLFIGPQPCHQKKFHKSTLTLFHKQSGNVKDLIYNLIKQAGGHLVQMSPVPEEQFFVRQ